MRLPLHRQDKTPKAERADIITPRSKIIAMPLKGGASDKFGIRYEGRWTVFNMADVLDERVNAIRLEPPAVADEGAEFWVRRGSVVEYHQVKRQYGTEGRWTIASLKARSVLQFFSEKLKDPSAACVFTSTHAAFQLDELTDRARSASSWQEYERDFLTSAALQTSFDEICKCWTDCSQSEVFERLKRVTVRTIDEETLRIMLETRLAVLVDGESPSTLAAMLGTFALENVHQELNAQDIWRFLEGEGCRRRNWNKDPHVLAAIDDQNERYFGSVEGEGIQGQLFARDEAETAVNLLTSEQGKKSVMLVGEAGVGKSSVTPEIGKRLQDLGWTVFAFRIDRMEPASTPDQVGENLGLPGSPANVLGAIADGRDCALVIDQLDAVSLASGRNTQFFECINEIIKQSLTYPNLHLVLGCRKFDIDNDHRLRQLVGTDGIADVITVKRLTHEKVREVVSSFGLDAARLSKTQLDLLSVPLHLSMLSQLVFGNPTNVLGFESAKDLYDEFWTRKQALVRARLGRDVRWVQVVDKLCDYMNQHQVLSVPKSILDEYEADLSAMVSEHVLTVQEGRCSFFHESFFDYAFARRFAARGLRLTQLLLDSEQHLFRRAQVRQILLHQREENRETYLEDLSSLLFDKRIRFHIKSAVLSLLSGVTDPTVQEWDVLSKTLEDVEDELHVEVWNLLYQSPAWFKLVDSQGLIEKWLSDDNPPERINRTINLFRSIQRFLPDRIAELLEPKVDWSTEWNNRIAFVMQWADLTLSRQFLDVFLRAIDCGALDGIRGPIAMNSDFWDLTHGLPDKEPAWAAAVIGHYYDRLINTALPTDPDAKLNIIRSVLNSSRDSHDDYFLKAASGAPREYVSEVLPVMLRVMELTLQRRGESPYMDGAWLFRHYNDDFGSGDALLNAMVEALSNLGLSDPNTFLEYARRLRKTEFDTAHFLLLRAYAICGKEFADEVADYLCENPTSLSIGYSGGEQWVARQVLAAITPHCSQDSVRKLEDLILAYYTPWERSAEGRASYGHAQFTLLEGIPPQFRSPQVIKRLEELRRKFNKETVEEPMGIVGGWVGSPIKDDAASRMTDQQWLNAIARYDAEHVERRIVGNDLVGGAGELASVMEALAKQNPKRFAKLALRFPDSVNIRYFEAVLRGVAEPGLDVEESLDLCRRCHNLPGRPLGRWVPPVVAKMSESVLPDEALEIVAWYATEDSDPEEDLWLESEADSGQSLFGGSIDTAAINCVRGTAAQALSRMLFPNAERLGKLLPAIDRLVNDKSIAVRASASWTLIGVLKHDRDLAVRLFLTLCSVDDAILRATGVERFMKYGLRTHYKILEPILDRMLKADSEEASIAGARLSSIIALFADEARPKALACISGSEAVRRGAAQVFATNLSQARFRRFCEEKLIILFNDESENVRSEAARCFLKLEDDQIGDYPELVNAFITSKAYKEEHRSLFRALEKTTAQLQETTCLAVERFFDLAATEVADISTHASADSYTANKLIIRTYSQSKSPAIQTRCLDLIDRVSRVHALGLSEAIADYER
jgi:hypothetical protein